MIEYGEYFFMIKQKKFITEAIFLQSEIFGIDIYVIHPDTAMFSMCRYAGMRSTQVGNKHYNRSAHRSSTPG